MHFFYTKMYIPFLLLIALANCAHLLSSCLASKKMASYIVKAESIKGHLS